METSLCRCASFRRKSRQTSERVRIDTYRSGLDLDLDLGLDLDLDLGRDLDLGLLELRIS